MHSILLFLFLSTILLSCIGEEEKVVEQLNEFIADIKVIDTHEHQMNPTDYGLKEFNFYSILAASYLNSDLVSAGGPRIDTELLNNSSYSELWDTLSMALNYSVNTSYYQHLLAGMKSLYAYNEKYFTEEGINDLSEKIAINYEDYNLWFNKAFMKSNFQVMFIDRWWDSFNFNIDTSHFALVFNINDVVRSACDGPMQNHDNQNHSTYYKLAEEKGFPIRSLDEYIAFADYLMCEARKNNAVCLKNTLAYSRSLHFEDVNFDKAHTLFQNAPGLTSDESKHLQDFMFHWIIKKSIEFDLPIQIHTGYFAGNGNWLEHGNPLALNNLFLQYPKARFVIFHGGYPWTGETIALGKMFSNVSLDLVWLPQISKERAMVAFNEMLDCVPYNKIFWGGDCQLIEESNGSLKFGRDVVIQVLAERITKGSMSLEMAHDIIRKIFRENAITYFKLEDKLSYVEL